MTCPVDLGQSVFPAASLPDQRAQEPCGHCGKDEHHTWAQPRGLNLTKAESCQALSLPEAAINVSLPTSSRSTGTWASGGGWIILDLSFFSLEWTLIQDSNVCILYACHVSAGHIIHGPTESFIHCHRFWARNSFHKIRRWAHKTQWSCRARLQCSRCIQRRESLLKIQLWYKWQGKTS